MDTRNSIIQDIEEQLRFENLNQEEALKYIIDSCLLRGCFDYLCQEWKETTITEKKTALSYITSTYDTDSMTLAMGMLKYCNETANKEIKTLDIIISLTKLIDNK